MKSYRFSSVMENNYNEERMQKASRSKFNTNSYSQGAFVETNATYHSERSLHRIFDSHKRYSGASHSVYNNATGNEPHCKVSRRNIYPGHPEQISDLSSHRSVSGKYWNSGTGILSITACREK